MQLCSAKFEGLKAFTNYTGYYSDMDGFEWGLDRASQFFSSPLPVGSDYFSLPHFSSLLPVSSGEMRLCYNNKTLTSQRFIFYSHKICWRSSHPSGGNCPLCVNVLVELCSDLFLWILLKLYTFHSICFFFFLLYYSKFRSICSSMNTGNGRESMEIGAPASQWSDVEVTCILLHSNFTDQS